MLKRARIWAVVATVIVIPAATTSWTPGASWLLTDERGQPASDAYVRYHYTGNLLNFVHPLSYVAGGSVIIRADADGRVTIPGRVHFRRPLPLSTPPSVFIDHVFVPRLHNAFGPLAASTISRAGVFTIDEGRESVTIFDVSRDPEQWVMSLSSLLGCIRGTLSPIGSTAPAASDDGRTLAHARELIDHLRREYDAFLTRYGRVARQRPPAPQWGSERDRQEWQEQADAQLAREPLWGQYVQGTWRRNLEFLEALAASMK